MTAIVQRVLVGEARCLQCNRVIAKAREYPGGIRLTVVSPHYDPTPVFRMRCPVCGGNLLIEDTEQEALIRRKLTPDELAPRRGRPAKKAVTP